MKKLQFLALLFVALFSLTLTSCDDDDDDTASPTEDLLTNGLWKGSAIKIGNDLATRDELLEDSGGMFDLATWTMRFNANGTGTMTIFGESSSGSWEYADNRKTIVFGKGTADESRARILKLTDSELQLEIEDEELVEDFGTNKAELHFVH